MRSPAQIERVREGIRGYAESCIRGYLDDIWGFRFDRARRRLGACDYQRHLISLSSYALPIASETQLQQTVLHEVAHARAGRAAAHGKAWLREARALGYTGGRTAPLDMAAVFAPWVGTCPAGHLHYRYRRPIGERSCGVCRASFDPANLIVWRHRDVDLPRG